MLTQFYSVQIGSAIEGFIWPKIFWDFRTKNLNGAVKPVPVLQILNLAMGIIGLAWEWPLKLLAGTFAHRSIEIRLVVYPLSAMFAALLYQGTHPAIYYLVGMGVYFWAYTEGEVCSSLSLILSIGFSERVSELTGLRLYVLSLGHYQRGNSSLYSPSRHAT